MVKGRRFHRFELSYQTGYRHLVPSTCTSFFTLSMNP